MSESPFGTPFVASLAWAQDLVTESYRDVETTRCEVCGYARIFWSRFHDFPCGRCTRLAIMQGTQDPVGIVREIIDLAEREGIDYSRKHRGRRSVEPPDGWKMTNVLGASGWINEREELPGFTQAAAAMASADQAMEEGVRYCRRHVLVTEGGVESLARCTKLVGHLGECDAMWTTFTPSHGAIYRERLGFSFITMNLGDL